MLYRYLVLPLAACVLLTLVSCGGGSSSSRDNNSPPPPVPPPAPAGHLTVTGTLTAPTGVLPEAMTVVSLGRESSVDGSGAYSAEVHLEGVSLLIAKQENRPFALARIVVADSEFSADTVSIDTTSTAVSLVFVSPFIMTQKSAEAASLLALIENDVAIPALAQAINDAFNDADPFQNANFRDALRNALDSIADRITPVAAAPNGSLKANPSNSMSLVRLPKRSGVQLLAAKQAEATSIPIDTEHTDINVASSGDQYILQPTSSFLNSIDWFVEVSEIDVSGFHYTHQWEPLLDNPYTVYPRVGIDDEPIGIDINSAQGLYRWVEFVSMGLNWLVNQIQNRISPDGISVSQVNDGLYIVRSFSSGTAGGAIEYDFVQNEVPNGALNHQRARIINHFTAAMDMLGIAVDLLPAIDDTIANDCLRGSLIDLYTDTSVSIEITNSVASEVLTATNITQDLIIDFSACVIGRAGITSATGLGWLNDAWDVLTGLASVPLTGAQLAERYTFMFLRATPLESMLIQVGSPIVDDTEPPAAPAALTATPISTTEIQLEWSESSDNDAVAEYVLYRDNAVIGSTSNLSFQDNSLTASTTYCYEVEAFDFVGNASGQSSPAVCATTLSVPDTTPPTSPMNLIANVISDSAIDLFWEPSSDDRGVTEYAVYRDDQKIQTVSGTAFSDSSLAAGTQYCYAVVAYDAAGNPSDPSSPPTCATTTVTSDSIAPTIPSGVIATAISDVEIGITWDASSDNVAVTGYRIFRDTVPVDTTAALNYSDSALSASTTYCYTISAYDAAGNESLPNSTSACATTLSAPDTTAPSVPTSTLR